MKIDNGIGALLKLFASSVLKPGSEPPRLNKSENKLCAT